MIGAGVFVGIGLCMGTVGPGGLLVTFALNGLIAFFSAMSFAELASAIPRAGGAYNFARAAFGRPASFIAGWMEWLAGSAAGGFYAIVLSQYTLSFFYGLGWMWMGARIRNLQPSGFLAWPRRCCLFTSISEEAARPARWGRCLPSARCSSWSELRWSASLPLSSILCGSTISILFSETPDGWKLFGSMGVIYVAFEGFEVIAQAGDETVDPKRNLPKGILYSVFFVTLTYLAVAFATIVAVRAGQPQTGRRWPSGNGFPARARTARKGSAPRSTC